MEVDSTGSIASFQPGDIVYIKSKDSRGVVVAQEKLFDGMDTWFLNVVDVRMSNNNIERFQLKELTKVCDN